MKKLVLIAAVLMISLFGADYAKAQVSLNINIGSQPVWGPTGYDHVDYYYFPDINAYYYVPSAQYIYLNGSQWVWTSSLPARYGNFDLYRSYKVVINKPRPYLQNNYYVTRYSRYKNYGGRQAIIRDSREAKYYVVKGHPNYSTKQVTVVRPERNQPQRVKVVKRVERSHNGRPERYGEGRGNERH